MAAESGDGDEDEDEDEEMGRLGRVAEFLLDVGTLVVDLF